MLDTASLLFWTTTTGVLSALATGLGAIPVHFVQRDSHLVRAFSSAIAAGMMISASVFSLAQEGINLKYRIPNAPYIVILGLLLGAAFFWLTERFISDHPLPSHPFTKDFSKKGFSFLSRCLSLDPRRDRHQCWVRDRQFSIWNGDGHGDLRPQHPRGITVSLPLKAEGASTPKNAPLPPF